MGTLYLPKSKKNAKSEGAVIVFEDEASFRQTPTLQPLGPNEEASLRFPREGNAIPKRSSEPSVCTTPVSPTCICKIPFNGRPI